MIFFKFYVWANQLCFSYFEFSENQSSMIEWYWQLEVVWFEFGIIANFVFTSQI